MPKTKIIIEPSNGLSLPKIGHLKQGEHELDLTADQIALFDSKEAEGVSVVKTKTEKPAAPKVEKPTGDALNAAIIAAIAKLDQDQGNKQVWTQAEGVPQTAALSTELKYPVSAAERDTALATQSKPA